MSSSAQATKKGSQRTRLTPKGRLEVAELLKDKRLTMEQACGKFRISRTAAKTYLKQLVDEGRESFNVDDPRKTAQRVENVLIEEMLLRFCRLAREKNVPVTHEIVREKALQYAKLAGPAAASNFTASNGFLNKFFSRHNLVSVVQHGEAGSVNMDTIPQIRADMKTKLAPYAPEDIYNMDEFAFNYAKYPNRTMAFASEGRVSGHKEDKARLTGVATTSQAGEKVKLWVIGKSANPRCFKNVNIEELVVYRANKKAWMTGELFAEYLRWFNQLMRLQNRKVALVVDNCPAHVQIPAAKIPHVDLIFLPPNVTSVVQPMDAGIIRTLKALYKRSLLQNVFTEGIWDIEKLPKPTVLQALRWLVHAWAAVSKDTVLNCWRHAGIASTPAAVEAVPEQLIEALGALDANIARASTEAARIEANKGRLMTPSMCRVPFQISNY